MDVSATSAAGGTDEEQQTTVQPKNKRSGYTRYSKEQVAILEQFFKMHKHPNDYLLCQLGKKLEVEPLKVKFWFQNKRTYLKKLRERAENNELYSENEKIKANNILLRETLNCPICSSCRCSSLQCSLILENLKVENALLLNERERVSQLEVMKELSEMNQELAPTFQSSSDSPQENLPNQNNETIPLDEHVQSFSPVPQADTPDINQEFSAHTSAPVHQFIPTPTFATIPVSEQMFCAITPSPNEDIPNHPHAQAPSHVQSFTTSEPVENIPFLVSDIDQDIPNFEQNISADLALDMDIPTLDDIHDISSLDFDLDHFDLDFGLGVLDDGTYTLSHQISLTPAMMETADNAMEELTRLLRVNEPFWFRSLIDGKFILQRKTYENMYSKGDSLLRPHVHVESSKDTRIVNMNGTQLVDIFLNADQFVDLFPTIVKSAQTLQVFESGLTGNRNGALQLMNAEMHILSPLVPTRHFVFLRHCKRVGVGVWVIADVSLDSSTYDPIPPSSRRFPSGCLIHEIANELCRVTWVEHIEVDDRIQPDQLFKQVVCSNNAYGAERWILTLERMCERFASASLETIPITDAGGVIRSSEERKSLMKFAHRMLKMFYKTLDMKTNMDFPHFNKMNDNRVSVCVRKNTHPSEQEDMSVNVATSFWLPLSPQNVLDFLKDNTNRPQWDVLCRGKPANEIQRIINGTNPENYTSIIRPSIPTENDILIMQESYTHDLESVLVYAPIDIATLNLVMNGGYSSLLPLLPSGFTITRDASAEQSKGSLVTLACQVPRGTPSAGYLQDKDFVTLVNTLVTTTVKKIKVGLNCHNLG